MRLGVCRSCKRGLFQICSNEQINGVTRHGGCAYTSSSNASSPAWRLFPDRAIDAEYCLLRSEAAVAVPKDVDPAIVAPLLCAGVTVFNGMRQMNIPLGEIVGIQGLGGLGHLALQYANKMGYRVVALSSSASKESFARDLGAHEYVDGSKTSEGEYLKNIGGAGMIVSTSPNPAVIAQLIEGLAPRGKLLILSGKPCSPP